MLRPLLINKFFKQVTSRKDNQLVRVMPFVNLGIALLERTVVTKGHVVPLGESSVAVFSVCACKFMIFFKSACGASRTIIGGENIH